MCRVKPSERGPSRMPNAHDRVRNLCPNTGYQELGELHTAARLEMPLAAAARAPGAILAVVAPPPARRRGHAALVLDVWRCALRADCAVLLCLGLKPPSSPSPRRPSRSKGPATAAVLSAVSPRPPFPTAVDRAADRPRGPDQPRCRPTVPSCRPTRGPDVSTSGSRPTSVPNDPPTARGGTRSGKKRQKSRIICRGGAEKTSAADRARKQYVWPLADRAQGAMFSSSSPARIVASDPPHDESDDIACC